MSTTRQRRVTIASQANLTYSSGSDAVPLLNDESASSWVKGNPAGGQGWLFMNFDQVTIPAGAQIRSMSLIISLSGTGGTCYAWWGPPGNQQQVLTTTTKPSSLATYTFTKTTSQTGAWTPATVNGINVEIRLDPNVQLSRAEVDVIYNEQPTVTVVSVDGSISAPQTSTTSQTPVIWWTWSDPDNDAQERYQIAIFTDRQVNTPGFSPDSWFWNAVYQYGTYTGTTNHTVSQPLPAGPYWAYVHAADVGSNGRYSAWSSFAFTIAGTPPSPPALVSVTSDSTHGYNVITARQNDNLLGYNQAGFENTADGLGWYKDTNVTTLASSTSAATNEEGARVLAMTATAGSIAKIRSGGTWASAGLGGSQNIALNLSVPIVNNNGGNLSTSAFTPPNGSIMFAHIASDSAGYADPSPAITISSSPALTWTLVNEAKYSATGKRGYCAVYRAQGTGASTTVTIAGGSSGVHRSLHVTVMTGVNTSSPVGAHNSGSTTSAAFSQTYTSTAAGSWGWLAWADYNAFTDSAGAGCSIDAYKYDYNFSGVTLKRSSTTSTSGVTVTLAMTVTSAPEANYVYYEVMPASSPPGVPSTLLAGIPVVAGSTYTKQFSAWTTDNVSRTCRCDVEWYDITGAQVGSTVTGGTMATSTSSLLVNHSENLTAPTGAVCAVLVLCNTNPGAGEVTHFDEIGLSLGSGVRWYRGGMQVQNLLSCDQGSLEASIGGWGLPPADTWSNVSRVANANVKSGQVLQTYVTSQPHTLGAMSGQIKGVTPGLNYTFYAMAMANSGTPNGFLQLDYEDANSTSLTSTTGPYTALGTSAWQLLQVTSVCPDDATAARVYVRAPMSATGSGNGILWTRMGLTLGTAAPAVWQPGPTPSSYPLVEGSDDGGVTWTAVRGVESIDYDPANSWQATVYDYEAPSNTARTYRAATAGIDYGVSTSGFSVVSLPSDTLSATLDVNDFYLVDPYTQTRFLMEQEGEIGFKSTEPQTVFAPLGRSTEVITYDVRKGKHFTFVLGMLTGAELDAFEALRKSGHVLFLQTPFPRSWYVKTGSDQSTTWLISPDANGRFNVTVELIEVDRPT